MNLHVPTLIGRKRDGEHLPASDIRALIGGSVRWFGFSYENTAPSALIGTSNHFEVAIASAAGQQ